MTFSFLKYIILLCTEAIGLQCNCKVYIRYIMKKNIVTLLSVLTLSAAVLAGCGEAKADNAVEETSVEASSEVSVEATVEESVEAASEASSEDAARIR